MTRDSLSRAPWAQNLHERERERELQVRQQHEANEHGKVLPEQLTGPVTVLPWGYARTARPVEPVPQLTQLVLDLLARKPELVVDLGGVDEHLSVGLLSRIMRAGRLDFRLACVFRDSGHETIREAIGSLDLVAAVPTHNTVTRHR
jgi:hypothetical protein